MTTLRALSITEYQEDNTSCPPSGIVGSRRRLITDFPAKVLAVGNAKTFISDESFGGG